MRRQHRARVIGDTGPCVVMVHGFGTDQTAWDHILPNLPDNARFVLFDLIGEEDEASRHYNYANRTDLWAYARDVLAILDDLKIGSCAYVGHSVGGMIGALASLLHPERFERLVLLGASPCYKRLPGYDGGFTEDELSQIIYAMTDNYAAWADAYAPTVVVAPTGHPAVTEFAQGLMAMRPDIALSLMLTIVRGDYRGSLPRVRVPCSLLQTAYDPAVPLGAAEFMRDAIPGAVLEVLDTKGHLPHLTEPGKVAEALRRHLNLSPR